MDFAIPERTRAIVEQVRGIVQSEVMPLEPEMRRGFKAVEPRLRAVREKVRAAGLLTPQMPRDAGGAGLSLIEHAIASEEIAEPAQAPGPGPAPQIKPPF